VRRQEGLFDTGDKGRRQVEAGLFNLLSVDTFVFQMLLDLLKCFLAFAFRDVNDTTLVQINARRNVMGQPLRVEVSSMPSWVIEDGSSASRAWPTQWLNTAQMRCGLTRSTSATRLIGISRSINARANASNSKENPLPGRAQGTTTAVTLPSGVIIRGTAQ
jgi:hypothetical protein